MLTISDGVNLKHPNTETPFSGLFVGNAAEVVTSPIPRPPACQSGTNQAGRRPHPTGPEARRSPHWFLPLQLHPGAFGGTCGSFPKIPKTWNQHLELRERPELPRTTIVAACRPGRRGGD